jgi:hypothetical protein
MSSDKILRLLADRYGIKMFLSSSDIKIEPQYQGVYQMARLCALDARGSRFES